MNDNITTDLRFSMVPAWVLDSGISDKAIRLYAVLAGYADSETGQAYPGRTLLSKRLDCSTKTVDRAVAELMGVGAIKKQQRVKDGHYQSSLYTVVRIDPASGKSRPRVTDDATPRHSRPDPVSPVSQRTRTTELEPEEQEQLNNKFEQFWAVYPKKDDKGLARRSFEKALKRASLEQIVAGAEKYRDDPNREQAFTKNPSTWLNADAWENGPLPSRIVRKPRKLTNAEEGALLVAKWRAEEEAQKPKEIGYDMGNILKGVDDE
tara:strand:- start:1187 stop:1978 length:792 start_codon:yes stop_codon:yes gene_type:complete